MELILCTHSRTKGNDLYRRGKYKEAVSAYSEALYSSNVCSAVLVKKHSVCCVYACMCLLAWQHISLSMAALRCV